MRRLITLGIVFGIGYVAGTRAGRQRYDDIRDAATRVRDDPRVQEAARKAEDLAREATGRPSDRGGSHAGDEGGAPSSQQGSTWPEHPDAHVEEPEDELVYSTGPDRP